MPTWVQLVYLLCAVCFILALKGLSGPRTARTGNLIGAAGAVVACIVPFIYLDLDHVPLILVAIALGTVGGLIGAQRVQMTQMPQMVALFNGVGGGAAALVALLELEHMGAGHAGVRPGRDRVHDRGRLGLLRRLADHLRQAPGPDDLPPGGLPGPAGRVRRCVARRDRAVRAGGQRTRDVDRRRAGPARPGARRTPGAAGRWRRRADRDLAAQRVHRPDRGRRRLRARQHRAAGRRHPGRRLRYLPDPADGQGHGPLGRQHPLRCAQGRLDARRRRGLRPAGEVRPVPRTSRSCWRTPSG